ncbi:MAG: hypothetical protein RJA61_5 [Candidatus Parcubacteria bacterium]|jgi:aspartyl-tRNA(Asn)/glutamyl-tRNA(Gln) amidotransferase subunit B
MSYKATIGLEIHAELKTHTKMFCASKNDTEEKRPNVNVCPVCMGHPGTLPVINKEAVKHVLKVGLALGGKLFEFTEFDRKNYFYPDIPKGYQISQYKFPLVSGGKLSDVLVTRVHLEEDTAKSTHEGEKSLVDFNRAGVPLMELVTEPVIHTAEQAGSFARELQLLLQYLKVSDANMEKGEMRVEANISISKTDTFGTKCEVKNLNSFRSVERAIAYEIERQKEVLESGGKVVQETRGWDETTGKTFSQRTKEDSHDYRYFPDPDLPKIIRSEVLEFSDEVLRKEMPELPGEKRLRYAKEFGIKNADIEVFVNNIELAHFFEQAIRDISKNTEAVTLVSNYIVSDTLGILKKKNISLTDTKLTPEAVAELALLILEGKLSSRGAKDTLAFLIEEGGDAKTVAEKKGLIQKNDPEALKIVIREVIALHAQVVLDFKAGKESALQFLIGQAMKVLKGAGNPALIKQTLIQEIG